MADRTMAGKTGTAAGQGWRDRRGSMAVEFAMIAPLLALILTTVIELGLAIITQFNVQEAVLAGANSASHNGWNAANIKTAVTSAYSRIPASGITVTRSCGCPSGSGITTLAQCDQDTANPNTCPAACGTSCSDGIIARKYVTITAQMNRPYSVSANFGISPTVTSTMRTKLP